MSKPLGPVLEWPGGPFTNPSCKGACAEGWSYDPLTNWQVCGKCRKPSAAYLYECPYCELVWLAPVQVTEQLYDDRFPRELAHPECLTLYG